MMKKLALLLVVMMLIPATSFAAQRNQEDVIAQIRNLLTEVYGYTSAETQAFTYQVSENVDHWYVHFFMQIDWMYLAIIRKDDGSYVETQTPFTTMYTSKASENSVRYTLRAIKENGWFDVWNVESKAALGVTIDWCGDIRMTDSLQDGLLSDAYTPAQALDDLFISCFGSESLWSDAVVQWRNSAFKDFELIREETVFAVPMGITNRWDMTRTGNRQTSICEFAGEVPDTLTDAFSSPELAGWTCLAGAYQLGTLLSMEDTYAGTGMAAFGRGEERLLVRILLDADSSEWSVMPISETALLPERDIYLTYNSRKNRYAIRYPISATQEESFLCRLEKIRLTDSLSAVVCELLEYRYTDVENNESLVIDSGNNGINTAWYRVTIDKDGTETIARYPALAPSYMEQIDASAFPKTEEACQAAASESAAIPEGYGLSMHVHLRDDTSSHSKDLGTYLRGTLVEILDTLQGTTHPWYKVRIGNVEGYMSSNYVDYYENLKSLPINAPPYLAKLKGNTALKDKTSGFSGTIADLPKGTIVRILAVVGNWLHVSIPVNETGWLMQPDDITGYVKKNTVIQGASALQLSWLLPDE
jgi:hypothetical protein